MFVVTFYSYKGGVGRTMALANVAALLAQAGKRVLVVDFDLEAPGIASYGNFHCARSQKGIVDFIHEYLETNEAPDVNDFIVSCPLDEDYTVWVMPAGDNASPAYSERFATIDWGDLYQNRHGYLLLEDLRQQWSTYEGRGFDYVLVDSRTGNTDIGGICTRQLPNAVVIMFVPTNQNVDGLSPIVDLIREEDGPNNHGIELIFCPSNIPDLFDEDDILGRALTSAAKRLQYGNPAKLEPPVVQIHHWTNMELLEQPIIVQSRKNSRLSNEYRALKMAIIAQNIFDREGASIALARMPDIYRAAREETSGEVATQVIKKAAQIAATHSSDGLLAIMAAEVFSEAGDYEQEEQSLSNAINADEQGVKAHLLRAAARINLNKQKDALDDLREVLLSPDGSSFEFRPAVQMLRAVSQDPGRDALAIFSQKQVNLRAKILLSTLLMQKRDNMDIVADELLRDSELKGVSSELRSDARNTAMLALVSAKRFSEAIALSNLVGDSESVPLLFNTAIAQWGVEGHPSVEVFDSLDRRLAEGSEDPNTQQCIALVRAVVGKKDSAYRALKHAEERILHSGLAFSCWSFTYRTAEEFQNDLEEMRVAVAASDVPSPPFLVRTS